MNSRPVYSLRLALRYHGVRMITKELRFALDEKGLKTFAPTLVGQTISYWDNDTELKRGLVKNADVARDRYGNPFIEVEMEEAAGAAAG
jgi:hypothetical protein